MIRADDNDASALLSIISSPGLKAQAKPPQINVLAFLGAMNFLFTQHGDDAFAMGSSPAQKSVNAS